MPGTKPNNAGRSDNRGRYFSMALGSMFKWAMRHRRAVMNVNPMAGTFRPPAPPARDRVLTDEEVRLFWRALDDDAVGYPNPELARLLLLTGYRLNEVSRLMTKELDPGLTQISLPGARTKNGVPHVVPLAPQAREIVRSAKRVEGSPLVFTAGRQAVTGWSRAKARIDAAITKANGGHPILAWRLHDLRRTCRTGLSMLRVPRDVREAVLNHLEAGVEGTYDRYDYFDEKKVALERWATYVEGIVTERPANVVARGNPSERNKVWPHLLGHVVLQQGQPVRRKRPRTRPSQG